MVSSSVRFVFLLLLLAPPWIPSSPAAVTASAEDRANKSSWGGGLIWSTAKDEADFLATNKAESTDPYPGVENGVEEDGAGDNAGDDELAGGFSSLDSMLQWAIGHSDPSKLKEKANDVKRLSPNELRERQLEIKELMEKLKVPSDGELMEIAIADLNNSSLSLEDRKRALDELLILVEPIDNANDLDKLGGLIALVRELHNSEPDIRTASAWILGKACQNNPLVQKQTLRLGALSELMKMFRSSHTEEAIKALYAVSALIRNNVDGQELFYAEAGELLLQDIMSNSSIDVRLRKKAVFLITDLADYQLEHVDNVKFPFTNHLFLKALVDLTSSPDLDLQEKALLAIRSLLQLASMEALILRDFCDLDGALERMREQLEKLKTTEDYREFAIEMESLCREVDVIFRRKLEKVSWVPT